MRKITKLSLAAGLLVSSSACADSLSEAFANAKVKGEIKAQYFDVKPLADGKSDSILVFGGNLNVITDSFYGFKGGVTFQTSHVSDISTEGTNNFANTMDASGSVMSESYLSYTMSNTTAKIGRQYIKTPLIAGSGSRMIKQSFEGFTLTNTDLPQTKLMAIYAGKYQDRTDGNGGAGEFTKSKVEDGAYSILAENKSVKDLTLTLQYLDVKGNTSASDKDALYLDAHYKIAGIDLSAQYYDTTDSNVDGSMLGFKASGTIGMINLTGLYTTTSDDGKVYSGVGSGADAAFTALPLHGGSVTYTKDTDTMVGVAATKIADVLMVAYYGQVNTDDASLPYEKIDAYGGFLQYVYNKNFSAKVMYESADFNKAALKDDDILRIYTSYKF